MLSIITQNNIQVHKNYYIWNKAKREYKSIKIAMYKDDQAPQQWYHDYEGMKEAWSLRQGMKDERNLSSCT